MSQKTSRKSQNAATSEEKEKRQTDSPVKEMKKKMAANAEKEKHAAEKTDKIDKSDKNAEKNDNHDKNDKDKTEKKPDKPEKNDKKAEKPVEKKVEKPAEKKADKPAEKKTEQTEKKEDGKSEKNTKAAVSKQNGKHNGAPTNGTDGGSTVSDDTDDDVELIVDDEMFPELAYDDNSDVDYEDGPVSRSFTRRSQSKILKLNEVPVPPSDRKLRSADSPKPEKKESHKDDKEAKSDDKGNKADDKGNKADDKGNKADDKEVKSNDKGAKNDGESEKKGKEKEIEVVIEIEGENESRVKTRARVSPYSRAAPSTATTQHDHTSTSILANYTGNNTTMEMDITESSVGEESQNDSGYLRGLRGIRGRASYRHCDINIQQLIANRAARNTLNTSAPEPLRPTAPVVGRKRKPDVNSTVELATEVTETLEPRGKRMRLLETLTGGFRRTLPIRRQAEIVGINTDLPLTAPVASPSTFDPESLKTEGGSPPAAPSVTSAAPAQDKRCIVM